MSGVATVVSLRGRTSANLARVPSCARYAEQMSILGRLELLASRFMQDHGTKVEQGLFQLKLYFREFYAALSKSLSENSKWWCIWSKGWMAAARNYHFTGPLLARALYEKGQEISILLRGTHAKCVKSTRVFYSSKLT